jgi:uncharacterized membrane protein YhfC
MVSQSAITAFIIQGIISFLIPVVAYIILQRKYHISFKPIFVGVIVFLVFSQILEGSINAYVLKINKTTSEITKHPYWFALYGALAAGIFEEIGRFVGFTWFLKKYQERKDGLAYGLGHGGIEALLIGVMMSIQNIIFASLINAGKFEVSLGAKVPAEAMAQIKTGLMNTHISDALLLGLERTAAFFIQLALSLLVLYAVRTKKFQYVLLAIFLHAFIDYIAVLHKAAGLSIIIVELFIVLAAVCSFLFIRKSKGFWNNEENANNDITY